MLPGVVSCRCFAGRSLSLRSKIDNGSLVPTLSEQYRHRLGRSAPPAEMRSWERSLDVLSADLVEAGLSDVEALVEYQLPLTSKRADVVLCGQHPATGTPQFVVVELKQWSRAQLVEAQTICVSWMAWGRGCIRSNKCAGTVLIFATSWRRSVTSRPPASPVWLTCTTRLIWIWQTCGAISKINRAACSLGSVAATS